MSWSGVPRHLWPKEQLAAHAMALDQAARTNDEAGDHLRSPFDAAGARAGGNAPAAAAQEQQQLAAARGSVVGGNAGGAGGAQAQAAADDEHDSIKLLHAMLVNEDDDGSAELPSQGLALRPSVVLADMQGGGRSGGGGGGVAAAAGSAARGSGTTDAGVRSNDGSSSSEVLAHLVVSGLHQQLQQQGGKVSSSGGGAAVAGVETGPLTLPSDMGGSFFITPSMRSMLLSPTSGLDFGNGLGQLSSGVDWAQQQARAGAAGVVAREPTQQH